MAYIPYPQYQLNGYGSIPMMTQNMNHSNNHHNNHHHGNNHHNNHHNNNTNNHHHNNHHNHNNQHNNQHHNNNQQNKYFLINLSRQIDYYFSKENLVKDIFLRKNMNDNGFLPLNVIANFYRVSALSFGNINSVIDSLKNCKNLVYGDIDGEYKVRAVFDPTFWVLPIDQRLDAGKDQSCPEIREHEEEEDEEEHEHEENEEEANSVETE
ncbi:unnamed protein product [[Candida] boidinii]|nr:unnamed protein product [[Candida] boidinii]